MMNLEIVLKVGGSLGCSEGLAVLCKEISRLGNRRGLLVVPGGGEFADQVRNYYQRYHLSETAAHRMALLAMDQYGCLLGDLIPDSVLVADLLSARVIAARGQVPILLPASLVIQADPLPHSWKVTSDSIAAWVAGLAQIARLILLKDVDGIYSKKSAKGRLSGLISDLNVERLADHPGCVDEYLCSILALLNLETWVINGLHPERLQELMDSGRTLGTYISRSTDSGSTPGILSKA
jgi:aspartokinase-like uncharacterized kinase